MSPDRARALGVNPDDCRVESLGSKLWEVVTPNPDRPSGQQTLTSGDVFYCAGWIGKLRRLAGRPS